MAKKKSKNLTKRFLKSFLVTIIICVTALFVVVNVFDIPRIVKDSDVFPDTSTSYEEKKYDKDEVVTTASLSSIGDLLIHAPVFNSVITSDGSYDFSPIFRYIGPYLNEYDYNIANLEVSLGGTENGLQYSGYPLFNCPDSIVDGAAGMGIDMLLLANNHTYDCGYNGFVRKINVIEDKGLSYSGVAKDNSQKLYNIVDINGIKIGIINYTYETPSSGEGSKAINGILVDSQAAPLINSFNYENLDAFYTDLKAKIAMMKDDGAEAIVVYPHWGTEYVLDGNDYQREMGQKMCDLGVDVIIGGHPHVVEPVTTFTSEISGKSTVCLYSMGNFISNQRRHLMNLSTGNTEDGLIFIVNFEKYGDGSIIVKSVEAIPTWVDLSDGEYTVIPLDKNISDWGSQFGLSEYSVAAANESYDRTMDLVGDGIAEFNNSVAFVDDTK
ncbi:MAG: CapA family protein [Ruminococcaceae bacterium]|nr:CapA family protein [Oscillospiraceae bacterium]